MAMISSRKAQVFSLIAVLMSVLFVMIFTGGQRPSIDGDVPVTESSISTTNHFVGDLEELSQEISRETGRVILFDLIKYHNGTNNFSDFTKSYEDCYRQGSFKQNYPGGNYINCSSNGSNVSFNSQLETIFDLAKDLYNLDITHTLVNVDIKQSSPFEYRIRSSNIIDITKEDGVVGSASWSKHLTLTSYVSIIGMPDPLSLSTPYERTIQPFPEVDLFSGRVSQIDGNLTLLGHYFSEPFFIIDQTAPSLTQQLEGNIYAEQGDYSYGNNSYGITSFLNESHYINNKTVHVEYRYNKTTFDDCQELRRIDSSDISSDIIFEKDYVQSYLGVSSSNLLTVCGECDDTGC
ncbi:MAG: hypothetical protein ACQESC_03235 [Nanobdellota archaeon]